MAEKQKLSQAEMAALRYVVAKPTPCEELERMFTKRVIDSLFRKGLICQKDNVESKQGGGS